VCNTGADLTPQSSITPSSGSIRCHSSIVCLIRPGVSCAQGESKGEKLVPCDGAPGFD